MLPASAPARPPPFWTSANLDILIRSAYFSAAGMLFFSNACSLKVPFEARTDLVYCVAIWENVRRRHSLPSYISCGAIRTRFSVDGRSMKPREFTPAFRSMPRNNYVPWMSFAWATISSL